MNHAEKKKKANLLFPDGEGVYRRINENTRPFSSISIVSPLGKAIMGKREGEEVEFFNANGRKIKVKILKIINGVTNV